MVEPWPPEIANPRSCLEEERTDAWSWSGKSSPLLVVLHSLAHSFRMTVPHPWCLSLVSQMRLIAKVLSEGMPLGEMEVFWGDGNFLFYYVVQKAHGQYIFFNICFIKIVPYINWVILEFGGGSRTTNMSLISSDENAIVTINIKID